MGFLCVFFCLFLYDFVFIVHLGFSLFSFSFLFWLFCCHFCVVNFFFDFLAVFVYFLYFSVSFFLILCFLFFCYNFFGCFLILCFILIFVCLFLLFAICLDFSLFYPILFIYLFWHSVWLLRSWLPSWGSRLSHCDGKPSSWPLNHQRIPSPSEY